MVITPLDKTVSLQGKIYLDPRERGRDFDDPREKLEEHLDLLWESALERGLEKGLSSEEIYQDIGRKLLDYQRITTHWGGHRKIAKPKRFSELSELFRDLGEHVAYLTERYGCNDLCEQEENWLFGTTTNDRRIDRVSNLFWSLPKREMAIIPSSYLAESLSGCSPDEMVTLYIAYLKGWSDHVTKKNSPEYRAGKFPIHTCREKDR